MNEKIIETLNLLIKKVSATKEPNYRFKIISYKKAISAIKSYDGKIASLNNARDVLKTQFKDPKKIMTKIEELMSTGEVKEALLNNRLKAIDSLKNIVGIGAVKAADLYNKHGITNISTLRKKPKLLTRAQQIGIKYYEKGQDVIPREDIKQYEDKLKKHVQKGMKMSVVGSYRRNAKTSGDVDILVSCEKNEDYHKYVGKLSEVGLLEDHFSYGKLKWLGYAKLKNTYRRVDILFTPPEEYAFALLYFTGSGDFNERMRFIAKTKGYRLNEHGIINLKTKQNVYLKTEQEIFKFLDMTYVEPENRTIKASIPARP